AGHLREFLDDRDHFLRRRVVRRLDLLPLGDHLASFVEHRRLDSRPANIDSERGCRLRHRWRRGRWQFHHRRWFRDWFSRRNLRKLFFFHLLTLGLKRDRITSVLAFAPLYSKY